MADDLRFREESQLRDVDIRVLANPETDHKPFGWTRFVCFSDTHGLHDSIKHRPEADVLLHAGDFTDFGELEVVQSFSQWLKAYPASHKVVIAGNHDITFHELTYQHSQGFRDKTQKARAKTCRQVRYALLSSGCTYLEDSIIDLLGYQIYGSPWSPAKYSSNWAFGLPSGKDLREVWDRIPAETDILVSHTPPYGIRDTVGNLPKGCGSLRQAVNRLSIPVSVFGHIHEGYGVEQDEHTMFVNASTCTVAHTPANPPIVFDMPPATELRKARAAPLESTTQLILQEIPSKSYCEVCQGTGLLLNDPCPLCQDI